MYKIFEFVIVTVLILINYFVALTKYFNPDDLENTGKQEPLILDVPSLIESYGYPAERHSVETQDGYILELHRIPDGKRAAQDTKEKNSDRAKPVVFLVHCILCTSSIWVMQGPRDGLGFMLADAGYDVWMMNTRGSSYSSRHVKLSNRDRRYWQFSTHEMGVYDVPASIDHILTATNHTQLTYIAFSMGTTIYFTMAGSMPEYNYQKVSKAIALAPAIYVNGAEGFLPDLTFHHDILEKSFKSNKVWSIPPVRWGLNNVLGFVCDYNSSFLHPVCDKVLDILARVSTENLNMKDIKYYFRFFPDYTSLQNVLHFFQLKNTDIFSPYDFGPKENEITYGSKSPPLYKLDQVNNTVHLIYSVGDRVSTVKGVLKLKSELPNVKTHEINIRTFSHAHFCWGTNAREQVYEKVLKILEE